MLSLPTFARSHSVACEMVIPSAIKSMSGCCHRDPEGQAFFEASVENVLGQRIFGRFQGSS